MMYEGGEYSVSAYGGDRGYEEDDYTDSKKVSRESRRGVSMAPTESTVTSGKVVNEYRVIVPFSMLHILAVSLPWL